MKKLQRLARLRLLNLIRPSLYLYLSCLILFFSCGTYDEDRTTILVSSGDKSIDVNIDGKTHKTPKFIRLNDDRKHQVMTQNFQTTYRCHFDFRNSIIPNSLITFGNPILGGLFFATDLISGGIYNCQDDLKIDPRFATHGKAIQKRLLILPPPVSNPELREKLVEGWKKEVQKLSSQEFKVLPIEKSWEVLQEFGIGLSRARDPRNMSEQRLKKLGERLQFTHIMFFEYERREHRYIFFPQIFSVFERELDENSKYLKVVELELEQSLFDEYFWKTFQFIPNSFGLAYDFSSIEDTGLIDQKFEQHPDSLPLLFRLFSLSSVIDGEYYKNWQGGLYFSPAFFADSWATRGQHYGTEEFLNLEFYHFLYGITAFWKTPFSILYISYYAGPGYLELESSTFAGTERKVILASSIQGRWQFLLSRRLSLVFSARQTFPFSGAFATFSNDYHLDKYLVGSIGLTYYFPSLEDQLKNLFR